MYEGGYGESFSVNFLFSLTIQKYDVDMVPQPTENLF